MCVCVCGVCVCVVCVCGVCVCMCVCGVCVYVSVCVWCVCVCLCVQQGSALCNWLRFCMYHIVYRLGPSYSKSFILSRISVYEKIQNCGSG